MMTGNNNNKADNNSSINDIDISIGTSSKPDPVIPLQFPPRADYFTGRTEQLTQLINSVQPHEVVALCGAGGMGKTALSAEVVHRLMKEKNKPPERFPDGVVFYSFYNNPSVESAMAHIAVSFGVEVKGLSAQQAAQRALNAKTALLILDGAEDADQDDLQPILAIKGSCGVLITTRNKEQAGAKWQDMQPLGIVEAVGLLNKWAADQIDNQEVATRICERLGGLPLAVRLVGHYLNKKKSSASSYLEWLEENLLEALDPDDSEHRHKSVRVLLARSVAQLTKKEQQLLAIFGCLAMKPVFLPVLMGTLEPPDNKIKKILKPLLFIVDYFYKPKGVKKMINQLINFGLLQQTKNNHYEVTHALIHTYAREQIVLSNQLLRRLANWYDQFARKESKKGLQGYHILDTQQAHILYLIEQAHQRQQWKAVINLVVAVHQYLDIRGYWQEQKQVLSLALTAAQAIGQRQSEGAFLGSLGIAYSDLGEVNKAFDYYQQALVIIREIGDQQREGKHLNNLGNAYKNLGEVDKAIEYYQQSLVICRKIGDQKTKGQILGNLGLAYYDLGELDKGIEYYQQSLVISREIGYRKLEGNNLGNLGLTYADLGEVDKAIDYHQQALAISREIGNRKGEGGCLGNLGNTYKSLGEVDKAIEYYQQSLVISRKIGDQKIEGTRLGNLGFAYADLGEVDKAIEYYQQALIISREIGDQKNEGAYLGNLGLAYADLGELDKAINYHQQALVISREIGDRQSEGIHLNNFGEAYEKLNQVKVAYNYYQQALVIFEAIRSPYIEITRDNLKGLEQIVVDSSE